MISSRLETEETELVQHSRIREVTKSVVGQLVAGDYKGLEQRTGGV